MRLPGQGAAATLVSHAPEDTRAIGARLGAGLGAGDAIALHGDLGAGKTVLVKGIARGLGIPEREVRSPTFTLADHHERGRIPLVHIDAYRLRGAADLVDLGLDTLVRTDAALVVEWAARVADVLPADRLEVWIEHAGPEERTIRLGASGPRSEALLRAAVAGDGGVVGRPDRPRG